MIFNLGGAKNARLSIAMMNTGFGSGTGKTANVEDTVVLASGQTGVFLVYGYGRTYKNSDMSGGSAGSGTRTLTMSPSSPTGCEVIDGSDNWKLLKLDNSQQISFGFNFTGNNNNFPYAAKSTVFVMKLMD